MSATIDRATIRQHLELLYAAAAADRWFTITELDTLTTDADGARRGWCGRCGAVTARRAVEPSSRPGGKPRDACTGCASIIYPDRSTLWRTNDLDRAAAYAARVAEHTNVYISMALVDGQTAAAIRARYGRIKSDEARAIVGAYADVDLAIGHHAALALPPDADSALAAIASVPGLPAPTVTIHTGGGLHAYWLYAEPYELGDEETRRLVAATTTSLQAAIRRQFTSAGWKLDSTADLARVLRLAGTCNHKSDPALPVTILSADGAAATLDGLEDFVRWEDTAAPATLTSGPIVEGRRLTARQRADVAATIIPAWTPGQRNPLALWLAGWLAQRGVPEIDARLILLSVATLADLADDLAKIADEVRRTYARARAGETVGGWKYLAELAGDDTAALLERALSADTAAEQPPAPAEPATPAAGDCADVRRQLAAETRRADVNARGWEYARRVTQTMLDALRAPGPKIIASTIVPLLVEYYAASDLADERERRDAIEAERARRLAAGDTTSLPPPAPECPIGRRVEGGYFHAYLGNPSQAERDAARDERERARAAAAAGLPYTPPAPRPAKGLAARIGTKPGTISAHLGVAHELGLIERKPGYAPNLNAGDGGAAVLLKPTAPSLPAALAALAAVSEADARAAAERARRVRKPKPAAVAVLPAPALPAVRCPECGGEHVEIVCLTPGCGAVTEIPCTVLPRVKVNPTEPPQAPAREIPCNEKPCMEPLAAVEAMQRRQALRALVPATPLPDPAAAQAAHVHRLVTMTLPASNPFTDLDLADGEPSAADYAALDWPPADAPAPVAVYQAAERQHQEAAGG